MFRQTEGLLFFSGRVYRLGVKWKRDSEDKRDCKAKRERDDEPQLLYRLRTTAAAFLRDSGGEAGEDRDGEFFPDRRERCRISWWQRTAT